MTHHIFRSAFHFLSGTLISRFTGLARDLSMAWVFGSDPALAAFFVAFRFSNLFRRLFGEGQMANGFIPHFESVRSTSKESGAFFIRDLFFSLAIFIGALVLSSEIGLGFWLSSETSPDTAQIIRLMMLMMPGIIFICLFGLGSAILHCEGVFFLSGFAPVAFNLVWIGAVWFLRDIPPVQAMASLAAAIALAFFMQWTVTIPKMLKLFRQSLPLRDFFRPKLFSTELRRIITPIFLGSFGIGAVQINSALDALFARFASLEGPAYLWYAIRIEQFPLALLGIALSSALLPSLSRACEAGAWDNFRTQLAQALTRCFSLIFPATGILFVLGPFIVNLFFGHGDFSQTATHETLLCLWGYSLGLLPAAGVLLLAPAFYAQKEFKIPMRGSLYSVILHLAVNSFMIFVLKWGAFSIAIATSLSAFYNFTYLYKNLERKSGFAFAFFGNLKKMALCTFLAGICTFVVTGVFFNDPALSLLQGKEPIFTRALPEQFMELAVGGACFLLVLFGTAKLTRANEILELVGLKNR